MQKRNLPVHNSFGQILFPEEVDLRQMIADAESASEGDGPSPLSPSDVSSDGSYVTPPRGSDT